MQIKIQNLNFQYEDIEILKNISVEIEEKDFITIIGPNGGGKSTLLKLILGIISPTSGSITVLNDTPLKSAQKIGYVPQDLNISTDFPIKVIDVVLMGTLSKKSIFFSYSKNEIKKAESALEKVSMLELKNRKINTLSIGQRQKVFIARSLCTEPQIMILDEPTSNIDSLAEQEIYKVLKKLNKEITIIVVSHDISFLLDFAKKIIYINKTMTLHNSPTISKEGLKKSLNIKDDHLCEVEILNFLSGNHKPYCCNHA